jgi:hypothetical protein
MVYSGTIRNGVVILPAGVHLPDGTSVQVSLCAEPQAERLRKLAGSWSGDDAEAIVEEIYAARSSTRRLPSLGN